MTIKTQALFEDLADDLGAGTGNERFSRRFARAVNRALDDLSLAADLATRHTHITGNDSSISSMDSEYEGMLYTGTKFHLVRMGQRPGDPRVAEAVFKDTNTQWEKALGEYVAAEDNKQQANDSTSMWGLGYLGEDS